MNLCITQLHATVLSANVEVTQLYREKTRQRRGQK